MIGYLRNLGLSINVGSLEDYQVRKLYLLALILQQVNNSDAGRNYVLKGGTSLLFCHGLDRFSEDIDFDGVSSVRLDRHIKEACEKSELPCSVNVTKDTVTYTEPRSSAS